VETVLVCCVLTEVDAPPLLVVTQVVVIVVEVEVAPMDIEDIDGPTGLLLHADKAKPAANNAHIVKDIFFIFSPPFKFRFFYCTLKISTANQKKCNY
jgi:hypothetical protein